MSVVGSWDDFIGTSIVICGRSFIVVDRCELMTRRICVLFVDSCRAAGVFITSIDDDEVVTV